MNENPEGTPNPLNPAPQVESDVTPGTGTEAVAEEPMVEETPVVEEPAVEEPAVEEPAEAEPISAEPVVEPELAVAPEPIVEPEPTTDPEPAAEPITEPEPTPRPVRPTRTNYSTVDPMMRATAASRPVEPTSAPAPIPTHYNDTFGVDESLLDDLRPGGVPTSAPVKDMPELVAKDSIVEPPKKSKGKKILTFFLVLIVLGGLGCGAAAVTMHFLNNNSSDRVEKAIEKLLSGDVPSVIGAQGTISVTNNSVANNESSALGSANIDLNGTFDLANDANMVNARANLDFGALKLSLVIDEAHSEVGDTFIKIRGLDGLKGDEIKSNDQGQTNCIGGGIMTNCTTTASDSVMDVYSQLFSAIDNRWILIPEGLDDTLSEFQIKTDDSVACMAEALGTVSDWGKELAQKMEKNQFIDYSTENLEISKKKNPLFRLTIDKTKLSSFVKSIENTEFIGNIEDCIGSREDEEDERYEEAEEVEEEEEGRDAKDVTSGIQAMLESLPTLYVEVDDNYNFTRLYFKTTSDGSTATVDVNLSYPGKFEYTEPEEYTDIDTIMSNLVTSLVTE